MPNDHINFLEGIDGAEIVKKRIKKGAKMNKNDFAKGAFLGVIAGTVAGILFAPKEGAETRNDIKKTYEEMRSKVTSEIEKAKTFSRETYDRAVSNTIASYEEAKKITPEDAKEIKKIFDESYSEIENIIRKDVNQVKDAPKRTKKIANE